MKELRERVFVFPVPQGATSLDFEVSQAVDGVPVLGYFMDDDAGQVLIAKRGGKTDAYVQVLPAVRTWLPRSVVQPFVDADQDDWPTENRMVRMWFIDAWKAAGGKKLFPLRASISFHDGTATPLPSAAQPREKRRVTPAADPPLPVRRHLSCTENGSSKFWRGSVEGATLTVWWGRIGASGQKQAKKFPTPVAALGQLQKLAAQKLGKGYLED